MKKVLAAGLLVTGLACPLTAWATEGLYSLSYGAKSAGMAGASLASGNDATNQFLNPANLSFIERRLDFDVMYLRSNLNFKNPLNDRENERALDDFPFADNNFFVPMFGIAYPLAGTNFAFGFQLYGLGGDASRFILNDFAPPAGFGPDQLFRGNLVLIDFGPAAAYKITDWLSVGATLQVTAGRLKLDQPFGTFNPPASLRLGFKFDMPEYGFQYAFGGRVSVTARPLDWLTVAVAYQTPRDFDEFEGKVRITFPTGLGLGTFSTRGRIPFTLPQQVDTGIAVKPLPKLVTEVGFSWINWEDVPPFGVFKVKLNQPLFGTVSTFASNINWMDQYVYRIGAAYDLFPELTLRAGYSYATNPVTAAGAFLTFPAYGFHSLTAGATWRFAKNWDISAAFERAFERSVTTTRADVDSFHANSKETHNQYTAHLQIGWRF